MFFKLITVTTDQITEFYYSTRLISCRILRMMLEADSVSPNVSRRCSTRRKIEFLAFSKSM